MSVFKPDSLLLVPAARMVFVRLCEKRPSRRDIRLRPLELNDANACILAEHRHHGRVQGHRFSIGCFRGSELVGCAVCGRPTSGLDPTRILEITRLCSDGTKNVCSMLYAAAARAAQAIGYDRIQTYIFQSELGASLKASGYRMERVAFPSGRHRKRADGQPRNTAFVGIPKTLWVRDLQPVMKSTFTHHRRKKRKLL